MKKQNRHSDANFVKGFEVWLLCDHITKIQTLDEFLQSSAMNAENRELAFKFLRIFSYTVIIESELIQQMYKQFETLGNDKKSSIEKQIIEKIEKFHNLKGVASSREARDILENQLSNSKKLIIPPVLQYAAGYTLGELVNFARRNFNVDVNLLALIIEFKEKRNYILHNPTSSRDNIDVIIEESFVLGQKIRQFFGRVENSEKVLL